MVYNSEEVKDPSFVILEDDVVSKMVFKKSDGTFVVLSLADMGDIEAVKDALTGSFIPTVGESTISGGLDITAAENGDVPFRLSATELTGDQTITLAFSPVPDTGGIQGLVFERSNQDRPLGLLWKVNGVVETALAIDAGTNDLILYWSHNTPGDQIRVREGPHIDIGRSVGHPDGTYRLRLQSVAGDPVSMVDCLYLSVNTAGPAVRALRITNEANTLFSVKTDNSGVGIGTLTPGAQLHVVRNHDATTQILLANGNNTPAAKASARIQSASGSLFMESYPALFTTPALAGHSFVYTTGTSDFILCTSGTDRLHLAANGRIGIGGVTVPAAQVDITSATDIALLRLVMPVSAASNPFTISDNLGAAVFTISSSGRVFGFTGSAATVGIGFLSDPNTGLFSNTPDNLQFSAGGVERGRFSTTAFQLADGINLAVGTTTGTKIGGSTTQKIGLWNATPVVQPAGIADVSGGSNIDVEARAALNSLIGKLETIGILAVA